jgi:phosphoribosylformylglycinamidine synthase PurS subunit
MDKVTEGLGRKAMRIGVKVLPRNEVLDSQGRAVERTLRHNDLDLNSCRVGKYLELDIEAESEEQARERAKQMMEFALYNPLIETYELEVL